MTEWKEYKLGEIVTFQRGHDLPKDKMIDGDIPVAGSNGIIGYHNQFTKEGPGVTIGRSGNIGIPHYYPNAYWAHNTVLYIVDFKGNDAKFMYYLLKTFDFTQLNTGSAVPSLNRNHIHELPVSIPDVSTQRRIASILSSLDDKIDLLRRENDTLEQMAETLFRQWFVVEAKEEWKESQFAEAIEVFDCLRRPLSKMERDKMKNGEQLYPYYGAAEIMDYIDSYLFDGEYILMGEDGTVKTDDGYPILQYATGKFWPNNHAHVLQAKSPYNNCFIWNYLKTTNIESIVTGAVQPKINQANLLSLPFYKYPIKLVEEYMEVTDDWWSKIMMNNKQIQTLIQTRDGLLPKLMSEEVKI